MDLEEMKINLQRDIERHSRLLDTCKKEYEALKDCVQPDTSELYNGIETFFSIEKHNGNYEYILGGDGRSQPWSETRNGVIATIKINKGIYLDSNQCKIVRSYVMNAYKPDHIDFK